MSSSRIPAPVRTPVPDQELLVEVLGRMPDPRRRRGVRHPAAALIAVAVCAVVAGARGFTAIGEWAQDAGAVALRRLGLERGAMDESTLRRLFARLDADRLDTLLGAWAATRSARVAGRRVIAIDGKTVRGARDGDAAAPHLVAALAHGSGAVLGQVAVREKSNEIPAARDLLGVLDLDGAVVTMDALHTQHDTATLVIEAGADYVLTVKANQKTLYARLKALPWARIPAASRTDRGHGRRATRTVKAVDVPAWIDFTGAAQVAQLRRTVTRKGKRTVEIIYLVTSADARTAPAEVLAAWVQSHWEIENRLHWVRDVTFDEDRSQVRTGNAPRVMAGLRNTAITLLRLHGHHNIAAALRHHARDTDRPINLLLTG
ncbi:MULTISPECIES: ISAs1 family transposase [unclassified Streptomyces]|uniref:ISAs1 family transposase n=1 Tax=unclassified Streptomyces TaxID=2593676 RepID=UPI0023D96CB9|nr:MULTISPECIES: ISAs1 family transposase [unclassified Streptomyces]